jgi:hypothetical protein
MHVAPPHSENALMPFFPISGRAVESTLLSSLNGGVASSIDSYYLGRGATEIKTQRPKELKKIPLMAR